jgi:hypothetical protein
MLIVRTCFLVFGYFTRSSVEGCLSHSKSLGPQSRGVRGPDQVEFDQN